MDFSTFWSGRKRQLNQKMKLAPYKAVVGRDMENYFAQVEAMCAPLANPFCYYEELILQLQRIPSINILTALEFSGRCNDEKLNVCLRHDIDADPVTALRAARYLAQVGVSGSFYLLHTSPYYAEFCDGIIVRNSDLVKWIQGFIVSGCEIGLHNDALGVQTLWGMDGVAALRTELKWLRSQGLVINGTVAHNSGPVYGAENYEIFSGKQLWQRKVSSKRGEGLCLGQINEVDLDLLYEGTFATPKESISPELASAFFSDLDSANIRSESWMRTYLIDNPCCDWTVDIQCWLLGKDMWVVGGKHHGNTIFKWNICLEQLLDILRALPIGLRVLMVVHPEYIRA